MRKEDRPYIEFERTLNKGISPRKEKRNKDGEVTRPAHPGEFTEVWQKSLVDFRPPFSPYQWVSKDWVVRQMSNGRKPVGYGNFDKLPDTYPIEWREKLMDCLDVIRGTVEANRRVKELEKQIEESNEKGRQSKPGKGYRQDAESGEGTLAAAG